MTVDQGQLLAMFDEGLWMPAETLIVLSDKNDDKVHILFRWRDAGLFCSYDPDELRELGNSLIDAAALLEAQLARQARERQELN